MTHAPIGPLFYLECTKIRPRNVLINAWSACTASCRWVADLVSKRHTNPSARQGLVPMTLVDSLFIIHVSLLQTWISRNSLPS
jgi:hypothetical protein